MTDNSGGPSMGDLFNQRRAARRGQQQPAPPSSSTNERPQQRSSFLDIQAEQEREQQRYNTSPPPRYSNIRNSDNYGGGRSSDNYGSGRRGGGGGGGGYRQRGPDRSKMPIEQGLVASLKDTFGFIYCADRPEEIFFHYSEVKGRHPAELMMDAEVEFRVGPSRNDDKMAAYEVRVLEPGTIVWETEEEPGKRFKGIVERPVRSERGSNQVAEGTIRVLEENEEEETKPNEQEGVVSVSSTGGPLVRFTANDYTPEADSSRSFRRSDSAASSSSRSGGRLGRGDLVEFSLVTQRRTGTKAARSIALIQSERERQRLAKEKEILANATLEKGVVTSLKSEFGFIRSSSRREEVYFHYSNVNLPGDSRDGDAELKEGQDMQFLVVTEPGSGGRKEKLSARKVEFLPRGSVVFHTEVAEGVTGVITRCPHPIDSTYADEMVGRVRLTTPIKQQNEDGTETVVSEVAFKAADAPGGSYAANRDGSSVGLWVKEGDTLLFDVVKELVDDTYCASPTKHTRPVNGETETKIKEVPDGTEKAIRMVSLSLAGRAEGVVHALKDNYGFISCVERPVDTYFRFYEVLPEEIQDELRENMQLSTADGKKPALAVGAEVQFDLFLQGMVPAMTSRSRRPGQGEKESLKAQRILVLPPSTITQTKVLAKDVKGIVAKEDPKQPYAGMIELEEELKSMTLEELHPLVAKLVDSMLADNAPAPVVFSDLQSIKEDQVVMRVVEARGHGELVCSHIPSASGDSGHPGRLCIKRVDTKDTEPKSDQNDSENSGGDAAEKGASPELINDGDDAAGNESKTPPKAKHPRRRKKALNAKTVKTVRFDKHVLSKELQNGMPLGKDDVVICDVIQSRRTAMVSLANVRVVERKMIERGASLDGGETGETTSGVGIVSEVVASRQFGFISVLDENAAKREMLFFQTSSIVVDEGSPATPSKLRTSNVAIRKGDEVKFDVGIGNSGKRVASNIHIVPKGTLNIPTSAEKNACRGLILMEPSHTSLANTPLRQSRHGPGSQGKAAGVGAGRWVNVGTEELTRTASGSSVKEEGSILLLSDPSHMFGRKGKPKSNNSKASNSGSGHGEEVSDSTKAEAAKTEDVVGDQGGAELSMDTSPPSWLCTHLHYKNGVLALHGPGSSSSADASSAPRRGDLVSFMKAKNGKGVRDIRLVSRGAATRVRGRLEDISLSAEQKEESQGTAKFVAATEKQEEYVIDLGEVVSCDPAILKENESVEGILHEGKMYGVCRTTDLYLESKLGPSHKERPRLNLTVRKERTNLGGRIMAQSMMAKGPDGTNGFAAGWTKRVSQYAAVSDTEEASPSANDSPEESRGGADDGAEITANDSSEESGGGAEDGAETMALE